MQTSSARWLVGITLGVVALAVVAIIVTLTAGEPADLPDGSPEAAVQDFIQAIDDGDLSTAYGILHSEARTDCNEAQFGDRVSGGRDTDMRVDLVSSNVNTEDGATVVVRVRSFSGSPPFDFSESDYEVRFFMLQEDDAWRIYTAPWPFSGCRNPALQIPIREPAATPTPTPTPTAG